MATLPSFPTSVMLVTILFLVRLLVVGIALAFLLRGKRQTDHRGPPTISFWSLMLGFIRPSTHAARQLVEALHFRFLWRRCVLVSSSELAKEVLSSSSATDRPDLTRFHCLFGGNRNHSMALCDWSPEQRLRKQMALLHMSNRSGLCTTIMEELDQLDNRLPSKSGILTQEDLLTMTATVFTRFFCGKRFHHQDNEFKGLVKDYHEVFQRASRAHLSDFLPNWLSRLLFPFYLTGLRRRATSVRRFVTLHLLPESTSGQHFTSKLWNHVQNGQLSSDSALYMLEDLLGGYAAVASMLLRTLTNVAIHPDVQEQVRQESRNEGEKPYTQAVVLETLRMASSPIIPHVANQDCTFKGWHVPKGTWFLFNQIQMNSDPKVWKEPMVFNPKRFLNANNMIQRPANFFPFGGGSRVCLGSRLVLLLLRLSLETLVNRFRIETVRNEKVTLGQHIIEDFRLRIERIK